MKSELKFTIMMILISMMSMLIMGCAGPEQKKVKFYNKGKAFYEKDDYVKARVELKNAIQIDPKYADAYYLLGMIELKDQNIRDTFSRLMKAAELNPKLWEAQLQLGKLFLAARLYDKALEKAQTIQKDSPDHVGARILEAATLTSMNKIADAESILKKLEGENCNDPEYYILKSAMLNNEGKKNEAEDLIKKGISLNSKSVSLQATLGRIYASSRRYEELIGVLKAIIDIEPAKDSHRYELSDAYLEMGKDKDAETVIMSMLNGKEEHEELYIKIAQYYLNHKRMDDAEKILARGKEKIKKCYDINIALSEIYKAKNKQDEAVAVLKSSLDFDRKKTIPGILKTKNTLANLYLAMNDKGMASQLVSEILQEDPKNIGALYTQGAVALGRKQGDAAVSAFRVVTSQKPDNEMGYVYLAKAHLLKNENLMAVDVLKNGLKNIPESSVIKKEMIRLNILNKENDSAESGFKELIAKNPKDQDIQTGLGDFYMSQGKKEKALETYKGLKKAFPGNPVGYIRSAQYYISINQKNQALRELEAGRAAMPDSFEILSNLVRLYVNMQSYQKAAVICEQQIAKKQNENAYHNLLGEVYEISGRNHEAVKAYGAALAMNPKWAIPANNIARVYLKENKTDAAVKVLQDSITNNAENTQGVVSLGLIYEQKGDTGKAKELYESVLKKYPGNAQIANNLAYMISNSSTSPEDWKKAITLCDGILKESPEETAVMDTLGWLYYRTGDYDKALNLIKTVTTKNPDNSESNYHMGMIQFKKGQTTEAKKSLEKAISSKRPFRGAEEAKSTLEKIKA